MDAKCDWTACKPYDDDISRIPSKGERKGVKRGTAIMKYQSCTPKPGEYCDCDPNNGCSYHPGGTGKIGGGGGDGDNNGSGSGGNGGKSGEDGGNGQGGSSNQGVGRGGNSGKKKHNGKAHSSGGGVGGGEDGGKDNQSKPKVSV